jgi:hypothetical protein
VHNPADSGVERIESDAKDSGKGERPEEGMENPKSAHQGSNQQCREEPHASGRIQLFHELTSPPVSHFRTTDNVSLSPSARNALA